MPPKAKFLRADAVEAEPEKRFPADRKCTWLSAIDKEKHEKKLKKKKVDV